MAEGLVRLAVIPHTGDSPVPAALANNEREATVPFSAAFYASASEKEMLEKEMEEKEKEKEKMEPKQQQQQQQSDQAPMLQWEQLLPPDPPPTAATLSTLSTSSRPGAAVRGGGSGAASGSSPSMNSAPASSASSAPSASMRAWAVAPSPAKATPVVRTPLIHPFQGPSPSVGAVRPKSANANAWGSGKGGGGGGGGGGGFSFASDHVAKAHAKSINGSIDVNFVAIGRTISTTLISFADTMCERFGQMLLLQR